MGSTILTVYLEFNVDEHELNNNEEEAAAIIMLPRARLVDEKARVELRAGQDGLQLLHRQIRQQRGPRSPASRPQHDQSANLKIVTIQIDWMKMMNK